MSKSDKDAVMAYKRFLENNGYKDVKRIKAPADIIAYKEGDSTPYYFEVKMTLKKETDKYFGAATETEWAQAVADPSHYKFVVVRDYDNERDFSFVEFSLAEFRRFCRIPPFKIYCNIDLAEFVFEKCPYIKREEERDGIQRAQDTPNNTDSKNTESISLVDDLDNNIFNNLRNAFVTMRTQ